MRNQNDRPSLPAVLSSHYNAFFFCFIHLVDIRIMSNSRSRYLSMDRNYRSSLPAVLIWKLKSCLRFSDSNTVITSIDDTAPIISLHRNISCFIHLVDSWILSNSRCQVTVDRNWIYHPSLPAGLSLIYIFNLRRKHRHYSKMNDTIFSHYRFFFFGFVNMLASGYRRILDTR